VAEGTADVLSEVAFYSDVVGMVVSYGEQIFADLVGGIFLTSCFGGIGACVEGAELALSADVLIAGQNPLAQLENALAIAAFSSTAVSDVLVGNTTWSDEGLFLGADTLVSGRNMLLGMIPEANIDSLTSISQFEYDIRRRDGIEAGSPIRIDARDPTELVLQLFWEDTFWQDAWIRLHQPR
jgi:hypothetical protein